MPAVNLESRGNWFGLSVALQQEKQGIQNRLVRVGLFTGALGNFGDSRKQTIGDDRSALLALRSGSHITQQMTQVIWQFTARVDSGSFEEFLQLCEKHSPPLVFPKEVVSEIQCALRLKIKASCVSLLQTGDSKLLLRVLKLFEQPRALREHGLEFCRAFRDLPGEIGIRVIQNLRELKIETHFLPASLRKFHETCAPLFLEDVRVANHFNGCLAVEGRNHEALVEGRNRCQVIDVFDYLWCELCFR